MKINLDWVLGMVGAVIWTATVFLRYTPLMNYPLSCFLLGVAPNFGVVWLAYYLFVVFCPMLISKVAVLNNRFIIMAVILLFLVVSEIIHDIFLNAPFDLWDMAASIVATVLWVAFKRNSPVKIIDEQI